MAKITNIVKATCKVFGITPELLFSIRRFNGSISNATPSLIDARALIVYTLRNEGWIYADIRRFFASRGLCRHHATLINAYYKASDLLITNEQFSTNLSQISNLMAIQCIPNKMFFLTDRCDGCCVTDNCKDKVPFTDKKEVEKHIKESLLLSLAACNRAGLDIDAILESITDADVKEMARRITMEEV